MACCNKTGDEVFFDPFLQLVDALVNESHEAVIGRAEEWQLLFVVHAVRQEGDPDHFGTASYTAGEERL